VSRLRACTGSTPPAPRPAHRTNRKPHTPQSTSKDRPPLP